MELSLCAAQESDCTQLHRLQIAAFRALLEKYEDDDISPGAEPLEVIEKKMAQPYTKYFFIEHSGKQVGMLRVVQMEERVCRISPICILPEYENHGYAQQAMLCAERLYPQVCEWRLDTIEQETKLCHLYEKLGYRTTGQAERIKPGMTIVFYCKTINGQVAAALI